MKLKMGMAMGALAALAAGAVQAQVCVANGEKIAFMGDSITQYGNEPAGYVNLVMAGLEAVGVKAEKIAAGVSGNKCVQMRGRLDRDALRHAPQWMTFSCGVNDVWHGKNGVPLEEYKKVVGEIFDTCAASNVNVIVLTPTMIREDPANAENQKLDGYVAWLRQEAARRGLKIADLNADMKAELAEIKKTDTKPGNKLTSDGVHMAFRGNCMMAWGVLKAMGVDPAKKDDIFKVFDKMPYGLEAKTYQTKKGVTFRYRWLEPAKELTGKYPLVVFLHGAGERGSDNRLQLVHGVHPIAEYALKHDQPIFMIAGQCPEGQQWVNTPWGKTESHAFPEEPSEAMGALIELLEQKLQDPRVDRSRVYVTGISMGGYGTWDLAMRRPEWFAVAIPMCGGAAEGELKRLTNMKVWAFHGDKDGAVPYVRSQRAIETLRKLGGDARLTTYHKWPHNVWSATYANMAVLDWMFSYPTGR